MLSRDLLSAYQATDFHILVQPQLTARPGHASTAIDTFLRRKNTSFAAILTAWNPFSQETDLAENERAQTALIETLDALGIPHVPAEGVARDGSWPAEPSLCLTDVERSTALHLARHFRQNAFLWLRSGKAAEIVLNPDVTGDYISPNERLFVVKRREGSGMTSVWSEFLCLERVGEAFEISCRRYEALAEIPTEYDGGAEIELEDPAEIDGKPVYGREDDYLVGGYLQACNPTDSLVFDPEDLLSIEDWLTAQRWSGSAQVVAAAIRIL